MTNTSIPPAPSRDGGHAPESVVRDLVSRITRLEIIVGALIAVVMGSLVLIEPNILEAPFENARTLLFTFGGTALAAIALVAMLWFRVPPIARVILLVVPFAIVNWWLISPYFVDDTVDDGFSTSISQQLGGAGETPATTVPTEDGEESATESAPPTTDAPLTDPEVASEEPPATEDEPAPAPSGPVLLGASQFVGLAGHEGTGDAGIFQNLDGSLVLRFENFDIENGPDLEVYLVPGADQTSLPEGSIHLGELKGNVGDQNYELPPGTELEPGAYTVLVWCEAFSVEFVGATIDV
jgi:hypothetical protein